jgi:hypothetical protein
MNGRGAKNAALTRARTSHHCAQRSRSGGNTRRGKRAMTVRPLYHAYRDYPLAPSWQERLRSANTEYDLVSVARDYLAMFSFDEISSLPEPCRPVRMVSAQDVADYAYVVVRRHCDEGAGVETPIHRIAVFFANANARLSELRLPGEQSA